MIKNYTINLIIENLKNYENYSIHKFNFKYLILILKKIF